MLRRRALEGEKGELYSSIATLCQQLDAKIEKLFWLRYAYFCPFVVFVALHLAYKGPSQENAIPTILICFKGKRKENFGAGG